MPFKPRTYGTTSRKPRPREHHSRSTTERGYGYDWQRFRLTILQERPLCEDQPDHHPEQIRPSVEVHHLVKIKHDPTLRLDPENVLALCPACHDRRTAKGE